MRGGRSKSTMAKLTRMHLAESRRCARAVTAAMLLVIVAAPRIALAQSRSGLDLGGAPTAGGEEVAYLRALALLDTVYVPVVMQPFSREAAQRLRTWAASRPNPWQTRFRMDSAGSLLRPQLGLTYHSALPLSRNDGVVWAGRGVTAVAQFGAAATWRAVDVQLAPLVFRAQNAEFNLATNNRTGPTAYGDARFPGAIDHVQAFGDDDYGRVDAGESFARAEAYGVQAGFGSTAMSWGPGREYPLTMSPNAGGFAHFFVGTGRPLNLWIGTAQGRLIGGRVEQSEFSAVVSGSLHRFTSGFVGSFVPRGLSGLEIGATRVMHVAWPEGGPSLAQLLRPFQTVVSDPLTGSAPNQNNENQFASIFARLAPPGSGLEVYGELTRDDFTGNIRSLIAKPDDVALLLLGASRSRLRVDGTLDVVRAELTNGELSHNERGQRGFRRPFWAYGHEKTQQGLTSRGQILGSPVAAGGSGATLAWDRYTVAGRRSISVERQLRLDWLPAIGSTGGTRNAETLYGVRYERVHFAGGRDWTLTIAPSRILNRNLVVGNDLWNLELGARWRGW